MAKVAPRPEDPNHFIPGCTSHVLVLCELLEALGKSNPVITTLHTGSTVCSLPLVVNLLYVPGISHAVHVSTGSSHLVK